MRFTVIIGANGDEGALLNVDDILNGNVYPQDLIPEEVPGAYREIPDCRYVREGGPYGQILTTLDTNNIDWCWNFYWVMCLYDRTTEDIVAFTSLADIKRNTGFDAKTVRHLVKNIKLDSQRIFFRL